MVCSTSPALFAKSMRLAAVLLLTTAITTPHLAWAQNALLVGAGGAGGGGGGAGGGGGGIGGGGGSGGTLAHGGGGGGGLFGGGGGAGSSSSTDYYNGGAGNGMAGPTTSSATSGAGGTTSPLAGYQGGAGGSSSGSMQSGGGGGGLGAIGGAASGAQATAGTTGGLVGNPQTADVTMQASPYTISSTSTYSIIGVGGGGGGATNDESGGDGGLGSLTISGNVTSTYVLVGGDGGGASLFNGGAGGTGKLELVKNGTLTIAPSGKLILGGGRGAGSPAGYGGAAGAGTLAMGDGSTLVLGAGAVVDTGADIYSTSNGGAAGTFTLSGASTIEVDGADTATISAPIGGSGALLKTGTGTLTLAASSTGYTYSGGTDIEGGVLAINNVSATYAASTNGPLTFATNNDGTYGELSVAGNVDLTNAVINVKLASGAQQIGTAYTLITANNITSTGALPQPNMVGPYTSYLTVAGALTSSNQDYTITITAGNKAGAGLAFTSGSFYGANFYAQNAALFATLAAPVGTNVGYWMSGVGSFGHVPGATYNYKGFVVGRGFAVNQHLIIGGAISNVYTNTNGVNESSVSGTNFGVQLYGIYALPKLTITSSVAVGHLGNNATRVLPGIGQGKFASNGVYTGTSLQAQYDLIDQTHVFVTPYAGLSYLYTSTGNGQETGAGILNLHYGRAKTSLAQASGGLDVGYRVATTHELLTAWVGLGGVGTLGNTHTSIEETLGSEEAGVSAQVASTGAFAPVVGLELAGDNRPWKLAANWGGQFANKTSAQNFTLQGSYKF